MKKFLLICCLMVATAFCASAQVNPVNQQAFLAKVSQLNTLLSQNDLVGAQPVWNDVNNMMMAYLDYVKLRLNNAVTSENVPEQTQFTNLAEQESTFYSEAILLKDDMLLNQSALIGKLNQFGANII